MRFYKFVTIASVAFASLRAQAQEPSAKEPTYAGNATAVDCLDVFNEARTAAGLVPFVSAGNEFRVTAEALKDNKFTVAVCKALLTQKPLTEDAAISDFNRTIALAVQDGDTGDCAAAVTHFNGALSLFGTLPPPFSQNTDSVYKQLQAVSFVALYNPKENPKLDCGYFTCTATTEKGELRSAPGEDGDEQATVTKLNGLLCATTPQALIEGREPFEQKVYDKIKGAINYASFAMPTFITVAVAAAGLTLF